MTLAHKSPIVNSIIFNLIREVHFEKFRFSKRSAIDSAIIPSVSESIMTGKGYQESISPISQIRPVALPPFGQHQKTEQKPKKQMNPILPSNSIPKGYQESILEKGIQKQPAIVQSTTTPQKIIPPSKIIQNQNVPRPIPIVPINLFQNPPNYGKLNMVIKDPFVQFIECPGPNKRLIVTKNGQKQQTNIMMSREEIQMLLDNVSSKTKIPLLTGVFRVGWDNFIINAIISDSLSPRFLIKKVYS
jgi:hypothetical protein